MHVGLALGRCGVGRTRRTTCMTAMDVPTWVLASVGNLRRGGGGLALKVFGKTPEAMRE